MLLNNDYALRNLIGSGRRPLLAAMARLWQAFANPIKRIAGE